MPEVARAGLAALGTQLVSLKEQILEFDRMIMAWTGPTKRASAFITFPGSVRCWRLRWLLVLPIPEPSDQGATSRPGFGLVPKQHSSGGKDRLGSISKQGDRYLRSLFVAGALAIIRYAKIHGTGHRPWLTALLGRRPTKVAAIALANKIARMAWAMMAKGERYRNPVALAR